MEYCILLALSAKGVVKFGEVHGTVGPIKGRDRWKVTGRVPTSIRTMPFLNISFLTRHNVILGRCTRLIVHVWFRSLQISINGNNFNSMGDCKRNYLHWFSNEKDANFWESRIMKQPERKVLEHNSVYMDEQICLEVDLFLILHIYNFKHHC